jgi:hypothetical protein
LTLAALVVALVACTTLQAGKRGAWAAFALVGWCYVVLVFGPWCNVHTRPRLITTHLAEYLQPKIQELVRVMIDTEQAAQMKARFNGNGLGPPWSYFERIAHCVVAWILSLAAAKVFSRLSAPRVQIPDDLAPVAREKRATELQEPRI